MLHRSAALLVCVLFLAAQGPLHFDWTEVTILTAKGTRTVQVELAETPEQRARGLMFREELPEGTGMLFDFGSPRGVAMWMKNTKISLDMLFIDQVGEIVAIAPHTQPGSQHMIDAGQPVRAVLELPAGTAAALEVRVGDHLRHDIFTVPAQPAGGMSD
ncbi:DUF192 domain-containing protein [Magnetospira thiophila]